MRIALYATATLAVAAFSPALPAGVLAAAAGAICEATPFLLAGTIAEALLHDDRLVAYLGCGCTRGASARSIPAAVATALAFGLWTALARFAAAVVVERLTARARNGAAAHAACANDAASLLDGLHGLVPASLIAGCASQIAGYLNAGALPAPAAVVAGVVLGLFATPCALGAVAVAAALHARAPFAAGAYLCIAGIVDLRALTFKRTRVTPDALAYGMLAAALAIVAIRQGDALVRPAFIPAVTICAGVASVFALCCRNRRDARARIAPALFLAGALVVAPPPAYTATETTMTDLFPGEPLAFTGRLVRAHHAAALVRYAVTCCRADAAPVVVRLSTTPPLRDGTWAHASGVIRNDGGLFTLHVNAIVTVTPPADPFIYR